MEKNKGVIGELQGMFSQQQKAASSFGDQAKLVLAGEKERNNQLKRIADALEELGDSLDEILRRKGYGSR